MIDRLAGSKLGGRGVPIAVFDEGASTSRVELDHRSAEMTISLRKPNFVL
jgi:hypothetical protein